MTVKKICAFLVCIIVVLSLFSCKNNNGQGTGQGIEEKVDNTRTQLYVSNFNGGYGQEWLKKVKTRFEKIKADDEFESGKKGVQILIDNAKKVGSKMIDDVADSRNQIFFNESINYYSYASQGLMLDITDMVTEKLSKYNEQNSIEDKFNDIQKQYLKYNGKYYAIPHYEGYNGITIDVELFDSKKLFMGKDGLFKYTSQELSSLSKGPDGIYGTYDDGLPSTYDEFYSMCRQMVKRNVIPFTWSGEHKFYMKNLAAAMITDCNGLEESKINFNFNGQSKNIIDKINQDGTLSLISKQISTDNGYEVFNQSGYYYALNFMYNIIKNGWYQGTSFLDTQSQTDTQDDYLLSNRDAEYTPIAMIVEGCWWESEATDTFDSMQKTYPKSSKFDRNFKFIPFPKANDDLVGKGNTLLENNSAYGFINANIDEKYKDLAIEFLQFCNTDESLREFTTITNTPKGLKYNLTNDDMNLLTNFGKSLFELKNDINTSVAYPLSDNLLFNENQSIMSFTNRFAFGQYEYPSTAMHDGFLTGKTYFEGLSNYWKSTWNTTFKKYISEN